MTSKKYFANKEAYAEVKYRIDFILSVFILIAALPFMLFISIILTVIFKTFPLIIQKRGITEDNQVFNLYKFRTLKINPVNRINSENILFKPDLSQYVPPFCRWLRKSGMDELPQLVNVMKGEMSLVGPRPLTISDLKVLKNNYPRYYRKRDLINVKPGITGMWQIFGNRSKGIENMIDLDAYYYERISLSVDLQILLNTILLISGGRHSDAISTRLPCYKERTSLSRRFALTDYQHLINRYIR